MKSWMFLSPEACVLSIHTYQLAQPLQLAFEHVQRIHRQIVLITHQGRIRISYGLRYRCHWLALKAAQKSAGLHRTLGQHCVDISGEDQAELLPVCRA